MFADAAGPLGDMASNAASKVGKIATKPSVLRAAGGAVGATVGHATGAGVLAGGIVGRQLGSELAAAIRNRAAASTPPPLPPEGSVPPFESAPVEAPPPAPNPILDRIAQGMGGKDFKSLSPEGQATVQRVANNLETGAATEATKATKATPRDIAPIEWRTPEEIAAAAKPAEAPMPESSDVGIHGGVENTPIPRPTDPGLSGKLNDLLRKLKIEAGDNPDLPTGEVKGGRYLAKFDEGGGEAPVIQSQLRKATSTSTAPANPSLIAKDIGQKLAGRITVEQFDSMSKNPKALAVITRQYGVEPDKALISMIRRRIKAKTGDVASNSVISIADLMRTK